MNTTVELPSTGMETLAHAPRIASIDIFRGLTMILMIFVNELAEIKGLMVFPAFLFILGMTIPIALERSLDWYCEWDVSIFHLN